MSASAHPPENAPLAIRLALEPDAEKFVAAVRCAIIEETRFLQAALNCPEAEARSLALLRVALAVTEAERLEDAAK